MSSLHHGTDHFIIFTIKIHHDLVHLELLIDSFHHHALMNGLIVSADVIGIKIHIQVIHVFYKQQGLKHIKIVHIKGVLRKLQSAFS